jgi:hypothetical protein
MSLRKQLQICIYKSLQLSGRWDRAFKSRRPDQMKLGAYTDFFKTSHYILIIHS